jgi:glycosyltransferase involved in cell wall biosynthesis
VDQIVFNKRFEIIFVDDGSTDKSLYIAKKFKSSIRLFSLKKNMGIPYASNFALKKSRGKYFIRVDSDDFINKHAINIMFEILESNKRLAFICCDHYRVDDFGYKEKLVRLDNVENIKNHGAGIMFKKDKVLNFGSYNNKFYEAEDYELITKLIEKEQYFYLPLPLYRYYIHGKNISLTGNRDKYLNEIKKNDRAQKKSRADLEKHKRKKK